MTRSRVKNLTFFISGWLLVSAAWGAFVYLTENGRLEKRWSTQLIGEAKQSHLRIQHALKFLESEAKILLELARDEKGVSKELLARHPEWISLRLFKRKVRVEGSGLTGFQSKHAWKEDVLLTRPKGDPSRIGSSEMAEIDAKFPIPEAAFTNNTPTFFAIEFPAKEPLSGVRIVFPQSDSSTHPTALVVETLSQYWSTAANEVGMSILLPDGTSLALNHDDFLKGTPSLRYLPLFQTAPSADHFVTERFTALPGRPMLFGIAGKFENPALWIGAHVPSSLLAQEARSRSRGLTFWGSLFLGFAWLAGASFGPLGKGEKGEKAGRTPAELVSLPTREPSLRKPPHRSSA